MSSPSTPRALHVWVLDPPGFPGRWPALLLETRQEGRHELVRVALGVDELPGRPGAVVVERWLPMPQVVLAAVAPFGDGGIEPPGRGLGIEADYGGNPNVLRIIRLTREGKVRRDASFATGGSWEVDGMEGVRGLGELRDAGVISTPRGSVGQLGSFGERIVARWTEHCPLVSPIDHDRAR